MPSCTKETITRNIYLSGIITTSISAEYTRKRSIVLKRLIRRQTKFPPSAMQSVWNNLYYIDRLL